MIKYFGIISQLRLSMGNISRVCLCMYRSVYNMHHIVIYFIPNKSIQNPLETHIHCISYTYDHSQSKSKFNSHQFSNSQRSFNNLFNNITTSFKFNNIYIASLLISRLTSCPIIPQKKLMIQHINPIIEIRSLTSHSDTHLLSNSLYLLTSFIN